MTRRGFSILELLIALCIVGILGLAAAPAVSKSLVKTYAERETKKLAAWIELIAVKASFRGAEYRIRMLSQELRAFDPLRPEKPVSLRMIPPKLSVNLGRTELRFYRTGVCSPATIRTAAPDGTCVIRLSLRGRTVYECAPA